MDISREIILKILNDDIEGEAIDYLTKAINEESRKNESEIDYDRICNLMYEKTQIMKLMNENNEI